MAGSATWGEFHGLRAIYLVAPDGASAVLTEHGAHVVSWCPAGGGERLYLSGRSAFESGRAIRGGVPVIFPQFAATGPYLRHGFARLTAWRLHEARVGADFATATFALDDDAQTRAQWPHRFHCELTASVGGNRLDIELEVENPGDARVAFTCALHTYLAVAEVELARLEGLRGTVYRDQTADGAEGYDNFDALVVGAELDRIYPDAPADLRLRERGRSLGIRSEGFPDAVVWNPWSDKCARLADMPPLGFRRMLCVEAAAVMRPVVLEPGQAWVGRQSLVSD